MSAITWKSITSGPTRLPSSFQPRDRPPLWLTTNLTTDGTMLNSSSNQSTSRTLQYAVAQSPTPPASPTKRRPLPSTPPLPSTLPSRPSTSRPISVNGSKLVKREPAALRDQRLSTATASTLQRPLSIATSSGFGHSSELQTLTGSARSTQLQTHSTHIEARSSAHWSSLPPPPPSTKPLSAEQYWTTRALAGESLHSVHLHYQEKLQQAVAEQEWKREVSRPFVTSG